MNTATLTAPSKDATVTVTTFEGLAMVARSDESDSRRMSADAARLMVRDLIAAGWTQR